MFKREKVELKNGLRLLLDQRNFSQSVSICCMVGTGALSDPKGKEGLAHVLEHYLFRAQEDDDIYNDNNQIKNIEKYGGSINAFTDMDSTIFELNVHKDDCIQSIGVLSRLLCNFKESEEALEIEKQIIIAEMNDVGEDTKYSTQFLKYEMLGANEGLKHIIGKKSSVRKITIDDLYSFYENNYYAENMIISIVGCFNKEEIIRAIEGYFSKLKKSSNNLSINKAELIIAEGPKIKTFQNYMKGLVLLFIPCFSLATENMESLELIADIYSDGTHSKLFEQLREKQGLIYSLSNNLKLSHTFGTLDIIISVQPNKLSRIIDSLIEISAQFRSDSYSDEFLKREKERFIKKRFLMMENNSYAAHWYAERELILDKNYTDDFQEWTNKVKNITFEDLKIVNETLFNSKNWFLICMGRLFFIRKWSLLRKMRKMNL